MPQCCVYDTPILSVLLCSLQDDSLGMQGGMDSDLEQHRHAPKQGPTSFDEQSGQTSGLMGLIGT